jgi:hypothetical protein
MRLPARSDAPFCACTEDLDAAVLDRVDDALEFPLPVRPAVLHMLSPVGCVLLSQPDLVCSRLPT